MGSKIEQPRRWLIPLVFASILSVFAAKGEQSVQLSELMVLLLAPFNLAPPNGARAKERRWKRRCHLSLPGLRLEK